MKASWDTPVSARDSRFMCAIAGFDGDLGSE
jgi:hypothetical protein